MTRPPYGSVDRCPKCKTWKASFRTEYGCVQTFGGDVSDEWLARTCMTCGYEWREACSDA